MEVTNSCAQSSHDQAWRMRPLRLKADFSAISTTLPQRGHLGRRNSYVTGSEASQANCMVIVETSSTFPHPTPICPDTPQCCARSVASLRREYETLMARNRCRATISADRTMVAGRNSPQTAQNAQGAATAHITVCAPTLFAAELPRNCFHSAACASTC